MRYNHYDLIIRPVITEKATFLSQYNQYVFEIAQTANKILVKDAIEKIFAVKVKKVNLLNIEGKVKRFRGRIGKQRNRKKAIITLEKDYIIDLSGGVR